MKTIRKNITLLLIVSLASVSQAAFGKNPFNQKADERSVLHKVYMNDLFTAMTANNIFSYYHNNGDGSLNPFNGSGGFELINGDRGVTIFEEGFVWGGKHQKDSQVKVGGSTYNHGLQAGRIITAGTPTTLPVASDPSAAKNRIYRVRPDVGPAIPFDTAMENKMNEQEVALLSKYESLTAQQIYDQYISDWNEWPAADGAPYKDNDGNGVYNPLIDVPGVPGADQTIWYVANDLDASRAYYLSGSEPIGIEFQRTIWAYRKGEALRNTIFQKNIIINKSGYPIDSMYIAQWSDPDIGGSPGYQDDFVGCDTVASLGYAYNGAESDGFFSTTPPAAGFAFLEGPLVNGLPSDSGRVGDRIIKGKKNLGTTAFNFFINSSATYGDPVLNDPDGTKEWYNLMRGLVGRTGQPYVNPITNQTTTFVLSGDPVTGSGWIDGTIAPPGDRRMAQCSGPFTMAPGDTQEIIVAGIVARGSDRLSSITVLRKYNSIVKGTFDFFFKGTPPLFSHQTKILPGKRSGIFILANAQASDISAVRVELKNYNDSLLAAKNLSDDGWHNDGGAGDGIFGDSISILQQPAGLYVEGIVKYQDSSTARWRHLADDITTAGPVNVASHSIASDHLNNDGVANPGENIRYVLSIKNSSPFKFTAVSLTPSVNPNGKTIVIDSLNSSATAGITYNQYDPSTYFSYDIPAGYSDPTISVRLAISDLNHNRWYDTLVFPVVPLSHDVHNSPVTHIAGKAFGNFSLLVVDSTKTKNHMYSITGVDSVSPGGPRGYTLKDETMKTILIQNHPLPDSLGHTSPIVDGFKLLRGDIDTLWGWKGWSVPDGDTRYWTWTGANFGMEGFNGAIGNAYDNFLSSSSIMHHQLNSVTIQFANTDDNGLILDPSDPNASFGYRYLRGSALPPAQPSFAPFIINTVAGYAFQDYHKTVPLAAFDITADVPRRLMVGYLENNQVNGLVDGRYWPPYSGDVTFGDNIASTGPREWLFIFDVDYSETSDPVLETDILSNTVPMMWFCTITRRTLAAWSSENQFLITARHPPTSEDVWICYPGGPTGVKPTGTLYSYELHQNFPNPFNPSTTIRYNIPAASHVTMKIYNLLGQEIRTLVNDVQDAGQQAVIWDSKTSNGAMVASGVYFYRIDMRGIAGKGNSFSEVKKMMLVK